MKRLIFAILSLISASAFAQNPTTIYWLKSRVTDSTTVSTAGNYGIMFWNAQAATPHWDIWNGSTMNHVFNFNSGGGGGGGAVASVFGRTGTVVATTSDYDAIQIDNTPAGNISSTNVQAALNELDSEKGTTTPSSTETFSNKSISFGSNTVTTTKAQLNTAVTDGDPGYIDQRIDQNNAATTSAQLFGVISDEVGTTGGLVRQSYVDDVRKLLPLAKTASFVAQISEAGTYKYEISPAASTTITFPSMAGQSGLQWAFWKNVDTDPVLFDFGGVTANGARYLPDTSFVYVTYSGVCSCFQVAGTNPMSGGGGGSGTVTNVTGTAPINVATGTTTPVVSITQSGSGANGYLSSTDWNTFNGKQNAITFGTGALTALAVNVGSAGAFVVQNGAAGTPSSIGLNNGTGLPLTTGVTGQLPTANGGIPSGGSTGQVLTKNSGTGYDVSWQTPSSGFANPMTTAGDIIYGGSGGTPTRLATATGFLRGGSTPSYSAVNLNSDVTGTLQPSGGGTGITSLGTGVATWLGTPSWTNLTSALTGTAPYWPLTGSATLSTPILTGNFTVTGNQTLTGSFNTTATFGNGLTFGTTSSATNNNQQISSGSSFIGSGWGTTGGAAQTVAMMAYMLPVQGTVPRGDLTFVSSIGGAANSAAILSIGTDAVSTFRGRLNINNGSSSGQDLIRLTKGVANVWQVAQEGMTVHTYGTPSVGAASGVHAGGYHFTGTIQAGGGGTGGGRYSMIRSTLTTTAASSVTTDGLGQIDLTPTYSLSAQTPYTFGLRYDPTHSGTPSAIYSIITGANSGNAGLKTLTPSSTLQVNGSLSLSVVGKTSNYTLTENDYTVVLTSGSATFTLPTAVGIEGRIYILKNASGGGTLTVATTSSQTVDGSAPGTVSNIQRLQAFNGNWIVI